MSVEERVAELGADVKNLGREIHELKDHVEKNRVTTENLRIAFTDCSRRNRNGNGNGKSWKHKAKTAGMWGGSGAGIGYVISQVIQAIMESGQN